MPDSQFIDDVHRKLGRVGFGFLSFDEVEEILEQHKEVEYLGAGVESIVIKSSDSKEGVAAAYSYEGLSPYEAKESFYLQRILSTLFPSNFPKFYAAFSGEHGEKAGTLRQFVKGRPFSKVPDEEMRSKMNPFRSAMADLHNYGIDVQYDPNTRNFAVGADGGMYYLDMLHGYDPEYMSREKFTQYMEAYEYSDQEKHIVATCLERLEALYREKKESELSK